MLVRSGTRWQRAEFAAFGGSVALLQGTRFAYAVLAAGVLTQAEFTGWALALAALTYVPALLAGVINGLGRELPYLVGSGDDSGADRAERAGWLMTTIAALGFVLVAIVVDQVVGTGGTVTVFGVAAGATLFLQMQQFASRSRLRFLRASGQQLAFGGALVIAVAILIATGEGELWQVLALYTLALLAGVLAGPFRVPLRPDVRAIVELKRLARIGFPIMLAGVVFSFFISADRWIAATVLGAANAAPYQLASVIASGLLVVPSVVSLQVYPRMALAHGGGMSRDELLQMAGRQGRIAGALVAPLSLVIAALAVLLVPPLLPEYSAGVPAVLVLCAGLVALSVFTGFGNYLNVIGRQWSYLRGQVVSVGAALFLMVMGGMTMGATGIALGIALGFVVYGVLVRSAAVGTAAEG